MKRRFIPVLFTITVLLLSVGVVIVVFVTRQVDEKTDMLVVDKATVNYNANGVANMNTEANTNVAVNSNKNTNTEIDTSDWLSYTNSEYGYTLQYPSDWTLEDMVFKDHSTFPKGAKYVNQNRALEFGVRTVGDEYELTSRILFYAEQGDDYYKAGGSVTIEGVAVPTTVLMNNKKVKQWFLGNSSNTISKVNNNELYAEYKVLYPLSDTETFLENKTMTDLTDEIKIVNRVLSTIKLY